MATTNITDDAIVCYAPTMITTNGIWLGDNPLHFSLPLFTVQLTLIVVITRALVFILKPLHQPRVISEIIGGVILGPSVLGQSSDFGNAIFPMRSVMVLETMANIGLLYFLFLVGVEMDVTIVHRVGKKALAVAISGMILPFMIGCSFSFILHGESEVRSQGTFILFLGVALSVTAFPVLSRTLAELKLLNTEIGRVAMSSALVNDMFAWILLAIAIALSDKTGGSPIASVWVLICSVGFVAFCMIIIRPMIFWMIHETPEGENFNETFIVLILTGVMIAGFITDSFGIHSVFGAFVFGLAIPNGQLGAVLIEKLEDFISGLLLPLFFATSGLKTDIGTINGVVTWLILLLVIVLSCVGKIAGTLLVSLLYRMPFRDGVTLGLLMNTKGLVEIIVLNIGKDHHVLDDKSFTMMIIVAVVMTAIITPVVTAIYKPTKRFIPYKVRTVQMSRLDTELRMLVCIHEPKTVPTIINLIQTSNPTKKSPICVYVLHLVELTGRASAMLIVHNTHKSSNTTSLNRTQAQSDHIIHAFESYEQNASNITVQPLTGISPYSTMHEDVCNLAQDKRVAIIVIPFHKQQTVDGGMEATNPALRAVNQNVLANAPCTVGILVDRGLSGVLRQPGNNQEVTRHVVVLFFGGPDDREALSYALRMSRNSSTSVHVMRFILGEQASSSHEPSLLMESSNEITSDARVLTVVTDNERELQIDKEFLNNFRSKTITDESIVYEETTVSNSEETLAAIRSLDTAHDLFILGRGQGVVSPLTAGLTAWSECPELGAIGDLLASSDFAASVSVLVIQQYVGASSQVDQGSLCTPDSDFNTNEDSNVGLRLMNLQSSTQREQQQGSV